MLQGWLQLLAPTFFRWVFVVTDTSSFDCSNCPQASPIFRHSQQAFEQLPPPGINHTNNVGWFVIDYMIDHSMIFVCLILLSFFLICVFLSFLLHILCFPKSPTEDLKRALSDGASGSLSVEMESRKKTPKIGGGEKKRKKNSRKERKKRRKKKRKQVGSQQLFS